MARSKSRAKWLWMGSGTVATTALISGVGVLVLGGIPQVSPVPQGGSGAGAGSLFDSTFDSTCDSTPFPDVLAVTPRSGEAGLAAGEFNNSAAAQYLMVAIQGPFVGLTG